MNDDIQDAAPQALTQAAKEKLKQLVSKIERLEEDKKVVADEIKETFAEAKAMGYDVKALRQVIRLRKIEAKEREEQEMVLDLYLHALGEI
jgi:uncharacterized protein (UPF0335 family)